MRYFIIFYTLLAQKKMGYGNFTWRDTKYPSRSKLQQFLVEGTEDDIDNYIILNVQEVTKKDYESWSS